MSKSRKIKLKGRELAARLTGIPTPVGGISWKPPVDERRKAQRLLTYFAGQQALHYPYDRGIGSFVVQSILDIRERLTRDIEALSVDSILRQILIGMQAACRKFLDENQSPSAGYGWPYEAQLYCTLGELRALFGIHITRMACAYDLKIDGCLGEILPPEPEQEPNKSHETNSRDSNGP
ncbi:MAG: hypothetical protein A2Z25_01225 [Planctomycetes bacterium RBG_16_55_9]|nr:MAG: hypothetical protein A2Z25_01225 [Planctomycetes bacterium RBG_16_55_9]